MSQMTKFFSNSGPGGYIQTLTGNTGGAVSPTGGNINIIGSGTVDVVGNPATSTLTISVSGAVATTYTEDVGTAAPAAGNLNVFGGTAGRDINTSGSGSTIHIDLDNAITLGDLVNITAGNNALSAVTGDINIGATNGVGNLKLVDTVAGGAAGVIKFGVLNFIHNYGGNTFVGNSAGNTATTAVISTGIGDDALTSITSGTSNTALGHSTLAALTTGSSNTALGTYALTTSVGDSTNTAVGAVCLATLNGGGANTCVGASCGTNMTTGSFTSALGNAALNNLLTGSYNIALGVNAGTNYVGAESSNIIISNAGVAAESNVIRIGTQGAGNGQQDECFIAGIVGVAVANPEFVTINSATGQLGVTSQGGFLSSLTTSDGNVVTPTAGTIILANGNNITTTGTVGPNTATISLSGTTNHSLQLGNATGSLTSLGVATNGQLPIGSTGADPVLATLTAGTNITITNGAGSISIAANASSQVVNYTGINHVSSPYTVLSTDYYISADVTGGVITVLLPNAPATGRIFVVKDKVGLAATSNITVTTVGGAVTIDGATSFVLNTAYEAISLIWNGASYEIY